MDHTRRFMEFLENPDKKMNIIHVAGTNGKGSTCAYLNALLRSEESRVGLFTSPHLEEMTERIRVNGREITKDRFVEVFEIVMDVVEQMRVEQLPHPTFFEFLFGMALKAFELDSVTYAILETGLGGRLDATNVVEKPLATVITSISFDHEMYLGDTITKIAGEKAGIIKSNVPVIYDGINEEASRVIEKKALEKGCECKKIADSAYEIQEKTEKYIAFSSKDAYDKTITWKIKNRGSYQVQNAMLAITTFMKIKGDCSERYEVWKKAMEEVVWAGRMEEVEPGIYIDGAHNVAAIEAISRDIQEVDVLLFSAVSDKNYQGMIDVLTKRVVSKAYIVLTIDDARGVDASELAEIIARKVENPIYQAGSVEEAWTLLKKLKTADGKALCLGSLYLAGMVKKIV